MNPTAASLAELQTSPGRVKLAQEEAGTWCEALYSAKTVSLQSWQLNSELGPDPRKLVSESCGQTVYLVEGLKKLKPLKTPNFRIRTNYPQMA